MGGDGGRAVTAAEAEDRPEDSQAGPNLELLTGYLSGPRGMPWCPRLSGMSELLVPGLCRDSGKPQTLWACGQGAHVSCFSHTHLPDPAFLGLLNGQARALSSPPA